MRSMTADTPDPERRNLTIEQRQLIVDALTERRVTEPCPRCRNRSFGLEPYIHMLQAQVRTEGLTLGGPSIPCAITTCSRCGWVSLHAFGTLGLLDHELFRATEVETW